MKVIESGNPWTLEIRCSGAGNGGYGCNALLLVEQADVFITSSSCRDETDYFNSFRCPECGRLTDLKGRLPFTAVREEPPHSLERKKPGIK